MDNLLILAIVASSFLDGVIFFFVLNHYKKEIIDLRRQVFQWKASVDHQQRQADHWRKTADQEVLSNHEAIKRFMEMQSENHLLKKALQDAKL